MRIMKKLILSIVCVLIVLGLVALNVSKRGDRRPADEPADEPADAVDITDASGAPGVAPEVTSTLALSHIAWAQSRAKHPVVKVTPQRLLGVMGEGTAKTYGSRIKFVHSLDKRLSGDELNALYAMLYDKGGLNMREGQMHAFKNDIANVMGSQDESPPDMAAHLILMHSDPSQDDVWRDYCIQHLSGCLQRSQDAAERQAIQETLWKATEDARGGIAGTAIISLRRSVEQPDIDKDKVTGRALEMVNDPRCGHLAKISALQMCAELGESGLLPAARDIADSGAGVPLRMSAIAAIGTVGGEDDRALLDKYAASRDVRLRKSARSALSRLGAK